MEKMGCSCKNKRERELESKGLKEKVVLEFRKSAEVFRAKGVKSFCAKRIKLYYYPIYSSNTIIYEKSDLPFILC